jgi:hypothetical protein
MGVSPSQQCPLSLRQRGPVIAGREQVSVRVHRHDDRGVPEPLLHDLRRQFKASVCFSIDAPRRIEVSEGMQASVPRRHHALSLFVQYRLAIHRE